MNQKCSPLFNHNVKICNNGWRQACEPFLMTKSSFKVLIKRVLFLFLVGLPHEKAAKIIAERFANKNRRHLVLVVKDQKRTPAEKRRGFMPPQH